MPKSRQHRRSKATRRLVAAGGVLVVAGGLGAIPLLANASTTTSATAGTVKVAAIPALATGDTRHVTEPTLPKVCAVLTSKLTMTGRKATTAQETAPPDTSRIQQALDRCRQSGSASVAVELKAGGARNAFLTGPLTLGRGDVLLIDSGVTLYGSRNAANYQISGKPACGTVTEDRGGCKPLISVSGANAGIMGVRSSTGHQGSIDGRGDLTLVGKSVTWWDLAHQAQVKNQNQNDPRLIQAVKSDNFTVYHVNLLNSANFHLVYQGGNGFTVWGIRIKTPANARNTDGIDPNGTNVTIRDSFVQDGDDGIAVKGGTAASNMTIENNHFYGTHGISIGSETNGGVTNILFSNNTLTGTDSGGIVSGSSTGIRIKSSAKNGGKVTKVTYLNTCLDAVKAPLVFDTHYSGGSGSSIPSFTGIVVDGVKSVKSPAKAKSVFQGYSAALPLGLTLENVSLDNTAGTAEFATIGVFHSNVSPSGTGVKVTKVSGTGKVPSCTFPAFPAL